MLPERWQQIDEVVQGALEREADLRLDFARQACGADRELFEEVARLLVADDLAGDFLEAPSALPAGRGVGRILGAEGGELTTSALDDLRPGDRLGPYRLVRLIGRGGMGVVYLAERADGSFEQRVAIKVVRADLGSTAIESRFRAERQILASLDHPSIARLLDGGTSEAGLPYLVMEHLEGSAIDDFCDRRRLGVKGRLELFLRVCSAVQYAHQRLVVHRDLKPTNVLVTAEGTAKLLDFGVAKLLRPSVLPVRLERTWTAQRPMTLAYASPEQLTGNPVTTASDVYSLGVILYQLLTGSLPRRYSGMLPADVAAMHREPAAPSLAVQEGVESALEIAERRGASVAQLRRQLRGDLDNIVLAAVHSDPEHRYPSVAALAEDLRRHLTGRPVRARPPSWTYTAAKLVRRNRFAAAATVAFVALLLAFAITMTFQNARLAAERDRAEAARAQALQQEQKAEQISNLMVGIFDEVAPEQARGHEVTVREVLDRRADTLASDFEDQPELLATLKAKMGDVYRKIGAYPEARTLLEEALALREEVLGRDSAEVAETLSDLAVVHGIEGRIPQAASLFDRSVAILRRAGAGSEPALATALGRLSIARSLMGDVESAEALSEEVLALQMERFGEVSAPVAHALSNLAVHKTRLGALETARELNERTLAIQQQVLPENHPVELRTRHNLGELYRLLGRYAEARRQLRHALEMSERVMGSDHDQVGSTAHALGDVLRLTGDLDGAEELYARARAILERTFGPEHIRTANLQQSMGQLALARGRVAEAERYYRRALDVHRRSRGPHAYRMVEDLTAIGEVCRRSGRLDEAHRALEEAISRGEDLPPNRQVKGALARTHLTMGDLHEDRNEPRKAAASWRRVLELTGPTPPAQADRESREGALRRVSSLGELSG